MKRFFALMCFLLPSVIFAQSNYHESVVVKSNGDTLKGYINYREWVENPKSIEFKQNKSDDKAISFDSQSIKSFRITGMESYIAYTGGISTAKINLNDLPPRLDTGKKVETVFLKLLADGKFLTLYSYTDDIKTRYFIAGKQGAPVELKFYTYYSEDKEIVKSSIYRGQLTYYTGQAYPGSTRFADEINTSRYEESDLVSLVNKVNGTVAAPGSKKSPVRYFAGIGVSFNTTEMNNVFAYNHPMDLSSVSPKLHIGLDLFQNPNVQRLIFRAEASFYYVSPRYSSSRVTDHISHQTQTVDYSFNQYNFTISPQVIFNLYNSTDLKVYLGGGAGINISAYTGQKQTVQNKGDIDNSSDTSLKPYEMDAVWITVPVQAGVMINRQFEISATYITAARYNHAYGNSLIAYDVNNRSVCLGFRYFLGKR